MRFVLFGHGPCAVVSLRKLLAQGHEVLAVVHTHTHTHRGHDDSLVAEAAALKLRTITPPRVNAPEVVDWVRDLRPQINIGVMFNQIVRPPLIDVAPMGFLNCHAGLLPRYRGRHVVSWAIINNEKEIGVTIHLMDQEIDSGDIIVQARLPIAWEDTYDTLTHKVFDAIPDMLCRAVDGIATGKAVRQRQDHSQATYFHARMPEDGWIDWKRSSLDIYNLVRASSRPRLPAKTRVDGRTIEICKAVYDSSWPRYRAACGVVVGVLDGRGVRVKTGDSVIVIESIALADQPQEQIVPRFKVGTRLGIDPLVQAHEQFSGTQSN